MCFVRIDISWLGCDENLVRGKKNQVPRSSRIQTWMALGISNHFPFKGLESSNWHNHLLMDVSGSELSHVIPVAVLEVALSKSSWQAVQFLSPPRHPFPAAQSFFWKPKFQKICLNNLKKFEKNSWFSSGMGWVGPGCHFPILCHWHLFVAKLGSEHYGNHQLSWEMGEEVGTTCEMKLYKPVNQYCPWKIGGIWMKISFILLFLIIMWLYSDHHVTCE